METLIKNGSDSRPRRPRECPDCGSRRIVRVDDEFFCTDCDWDSVDIYARISVLANPREHTGRQYEE
jgi:hypothetical protein